MPLTDTETSQSQDSVSRALLHGRILICEHSAENAELYRMALTQAGGDVQIADDEKSIAEAIAKDCPELLLLNNSLPGVHVPELIRRLKGTDETLYLPVIILTGEGAEPETSLEAGADDFLKQPFHPTELILRAKLLLRLGRLHQDLADNNAELQSAYEIARESEAKYRALIYEAQDAIVLVDPVTSTILEVNRCACELSGYESDDLIGQPVHILCPEDAPTKWDALVSRVTTVGRGSDIGFCLLCKAGKTIPVEIQASLANHHLGRPIIQTLVHDLRPRHLLDAERAKSERLAAVVETAVTVNHEINNPLLVITSSVDGLQRALYNSDSSIREKLARINEACLRIQRFTHQLTAVIAPVSKEYLPGMRMLDMQQSIAPEEDDASAL